MDIKGMEKLVAHIRLSIKESLVNFMKEINTTELNCKDSDIVVLSDLNEGSYSYTLDSIRLTSDNYIMVYCSNCEESQHFSILGLNVEIMLEIAKYVMER